ncbi:hypothetical protein D1816_23810 [Aquimarina sp. AD10]|uniref:sensor histidine kinase n=1 Tax=Aquimarina sp. AD10 TaxID=1714849 RepID=UPI000E4CA0FE|nr:ATP-binding protein [Aquimarina sp. AD10]AXT63244.1 hypothetical protein D1816_23810 [Aquimarina sp. AD10]RKN00743.1 hypothetical protein D7033_07885 [Aquimarina sp. AD10]
MQFQYLLRYERKARIVYLLITSLFFNSVFGQSKRRLNSDIDSLSVLINQWKLEMEAVGLNNENLHQKIERLNSEVAAPAPSYFIHLGNYYFDKANQSLSFQNYNKAFDLSITTKDKLLICNSAHQILELIKRNDSLSSYNGKYISGYIKYATTLSQKAYSIYYQKYFELVASKNFRFADFTDGLDLAIKSNNYKCIADYYQLLGVGYDVFLGKSDSALFYYKKVEDIVKRDTTYYNKSRLQGVYNNIGVLEYQNNHLQNAIGNFRKALSIDTTSRKLKSRIFILGWLEQSYKKLGNLDSAYLFLSNKVNLENKFSQIEYASQIARYKRKYDLEKSQKENTILESNKRNLQLISFTIALIALILFLLMLNYRNKKKLAESEKHMEMEKADKLLKRQEIVGIDAMISGQEKERKKIADDLHDNLGSVFALISHHFDYLKKKKQKLLDIEDDMIEKTSELIEEAYQKIRAMAHSRNSITIGGQNLIQSINQFVKQLNSLSNLNFEVISDGMDVSIDNEVEIQLFRMIQELTTNVIKHSNADEANIYLTNYGDKISLIVEDNGVGFDHNNIVDGMGLSSIKDRIELLRGDIVIDSNENSGTSVIIEVSTI